jgi:hypothetical protein
MAVRRVNLQFPAAAAQAVPPPADVQVVAQRLSPAAEAVQATADVPALAVAQATRESPGAPATGMAAAARSPAVTRAAS